MNNKNNTSFKKIIIIAIIVYIIFYEIKNFNFLNIIQTLFNNFIKIDFKIFGLTVSFFGFFAIIGIKCKIFPTKVFSIKKIINENLDFGETDPEVKHVQDIPYYREIPCDGNILEAYWICYHYGIIPKNKLKRGIIGAILLKWVKNGNIYITEQNKNLNTQHYLIDLSNASGIEIKIEKELFNILLEAAGSNKLLESHELKNYCETNYNKIENWFIKLNEYARDELEKKKLVVRKSKKVITKSGDIDKIVVNSVSDEMKDEAIQLIGLKKFLLDYSLTKERRYEEVHLWEEYLIFAQLLGISENVEKQLKDLNPNFITVSFAVNILSGNFILWSYTTIVLNFIYLLYLPLVVPIYLAYRRSYKKRK